MAISLASISKGMQKRAPRIFLVGTEKIGKSTFASKAPNPIFIPVAGERGLDAIDTSKFPPVKTFDELLECLSVLYQSDHEYQTVVIDSISTLEPLIWAKCCSENIDGKGNPSVVTSIERVGGGYGKGYIEALKSWRELMDGLDALRDDKAMASILIGHVRVKTFTDPMADPYDTYVADLNDKAAAAIYRWADCILFAKAKTTIKTNDLGMKKQNRGIGGRDAVLYTQKRDGHPGGCRSAHTIPYELPFNWESWEAAWTGKGETDKQ